MIFLCVCRGREGEMCIGAVAGERRIESMEIVWFQAAHRDREDRGSVPPEEEAARHHPET
jgi:hypothetical protein